MPVSTECAAALLSFRYPSLHVISLLTLSSIVIEGEKLAKLNKMNWTAVAQPL